MSVDWNDILIERPDPLGGGSPAERTIQRFQCAITLSLPQTPAFIKALSHEQRTMYTKRWSVMKCALGMDNLKDSKHVFEFFESGHVHLHGMMTFEFNHKFSPTGAIADIVKTYLRTLPSKYSKYNGQNMKHFKDGITYKCASICVKTLEGQDNIDTWIKYMNKHQ